VPNGSYTFKLDWLYISSLLENPVLSADVTSCQVLFISRVRSLLAGWNSIDTMPLLNSAKTSSSSRAMTEENRKRSLVAPQPAISMAIVRGIARNAALGIKHISVYFSCGSYGSRNFCAKLLRQTGSVPKLRKIIVSFVKTRSVGRKISFRPWFYTRERMYRIYNAYFHIYSNGFCSRVVFDVENLME